MNKYFYTIPNRRSLRISLTQSFIKKMGIIFLEPRAIPAVLYSGDPQTFRRHEKPTIIGFSDFECRTFLSVLFSAYFLTVKRV